MKLFMFDGMLTVAQTNVEALENFKREHSHIYFGDVSEFEMEEVNEVNGHKIQIG